MTVGVVLTEVGVVVGIVAGGIAIITFLAKVGLWLVGQGRGSVTQAQPVERQRELGEDCAVALTQTKALIDGAWVGVLQWGQEWDEREDLRENYESLQTAGLDLIRRRTRVRVVFGPDNPAAVAFTDAASAAEEVYYALQDIRRERDPRPEHEDAARQVQAYFERDREKIQRARDRFADAQIRFEDSVSRR